METKMLLSIFTPTYNRRNKLEQLYRSLKNQIDDECEWIIVDDGSTDATEKVILQFCNESVCNIRYIKKENGGKHHEQTINCNSYRRSGGCRAGNRSNGPGGQQGGGSGQMYHRRRPEDHGAGCQNHGGRGKSKRG